MKLKVVMLGWAVIIYGMQVNAQVAPKEPVKKPKEQTTGLQEPPPPPPPPPHAKKAKKAHAPRPHAVPHKLENPVPPPPPPMPPAKKQ